MGVRRFVLVTHRWMGLGSAAILALLGVTGVVLQWSEDVELLAALHRYASPLHERLALGRFGHWVVVIATGVAALLELGGLVLWWKRKTLMVRRGAGWWRFCYDLHHVIGVVLVPLMFVIAVAGIGLAFVPSNDSPQLYRLMARLHKGHFPFPMNALYSIASLGFVAQGLTGVLMWWKPEGLQNRRTKYRVE
jgi:uncharacterized iron-regulated membrane protein